MHNRVNIIELDALVKTFPTGQRALDHLSLSVSTGIIFGFIGLNGAGKTTTIRILAGLTRPDSGTVRLFGAEVDPRDQALKRNLGFVLDEPLYFDWMSPGEYLRFVGLMEGLSGRESAHRTLELLEFFDLETKRRDPISTLSTGMKKKVSLAAAIIHGPRLVVLDEPLEGIDALAASTVKETLSMMAARGATIFITSHVLDTIERFCSEVAVIDRGKVVLQCKTSEISTRGKGKLSSGSFSSLEELFVELVSTKVRKRSLSYM